jgi:two-component sensor histidine kinase
MNRDSRRGETPGETGPSFPYDRLVPKIQALVFRNHPVASFVASVALYAAVILVFGDQLRVSSNYFIILPIIATALGSGLVAGTIAGTLGLPANLLLFAVLGHPEFSPESKLIAELSGITVGFSFGALSDYFRSVETEIARRTAVEAELRTALDEKVLLLRELNHRVRNNLNIVKSLVQLQRNRSKDALFITAANELIGRIFAIAVVHDQLSGASGPLSVDPAIYLESLATNVVTSLGMDGSRLALDIGARGRRLPADAAMSLGLILNEALTNALKHAPLVAGGQPALRLSFGFEEGCYSLRIEDDGPGPGDSGSTPEGGSLGLKIIDILAKNLGGRAGLGPGYAGECGTRFELVFPDPTDKEKPGVSATRS